MKDNAKYENSCFEPLMGDLQVFKHSDHLWLDRKRIVDFLSVIELFR